MSLSISLFNSSTITSSVSLNIFLKLWKLKSPDFKCFIFSSVPIPLESSLPKNIELCQDQISTLFSLENATSTRIKSTTISFLCDSNYKSFQYPQSDICLKKLGIALEEIIKIPHCKCITIGDSFMAKVPENVLSKQELVTGILITVTESPEDITQDLLEVMYRSIVCSFENEQTKKRPSAFDILMQPKKVQKVDNILPVTKHVSSWDSALSGYYTHPETYSNEVVLHYDNDLVVIKDAFPKAQCHFLIMPRISITSLTCLTSSQIPLLRSMHALANKIILKFGGDRLFRCGFHSVPSMNQLHMHVISQDFDSLSLKNKRHWNSFTTSFFIPFNKVIQELTETDPYFKIDKETNEALLKNDLKCHRCGENIKNIPGLRKHLTLCLK